MVVPAAIYAAVGISEVAWNRLPPTTQNQIKGLVKAGAVGLAASIANRFLKKKKKPAKPKRKTPKKTSKKKVKR